MKKELQKKLLIYNSYMKYIKTNHGERGHTLQTLTITAVLVIMAVIAGMIILALGRSQARNLETTVPYFGNPLAIETTSDDNAPGVPQTESQTQTQTGKQGGPQTNQQTGKQGDPQTQTDQQNDPQTQTQTDPQTSQQTNQQNDPQTQTQTDQQTNQQNDPQTQTDPQTSQQTNQQNDPQTQTQTQQGDDQPVANTQPSVSIRSSEAVEGNNIEFRLILSQPTTTNVIVIYSTTNGTAQSGTNYEVRYEEPATILAGQTETVISIPTYPDDTYIGDQTFTIQLISITTNNALLDITDTAADMVIREQTTQPPPDPDNDNTPDLPVVSLSDADPVTEGQDLTFEVRLDRPAPRDLAIYYQTEPGTSLLQWHLAQQPPNDDEEDKRERFCRYGQDQHTQGIGAVAGTDFTAHPSGSYVTIPAGSSTADITVKTLDDDIEQYQHGLKLNLDLSRTRSNGVNLAASPSGTQAIGIITDNESRPTYTVQSEPNIAESTAGRFPITVRQSSASERCYFTKISYTQDPLERITDHSPLDNTASEDYGQAGQNTYQNVNSANWNLSFDMNNISSAVFPAGVTTSIRSLVAICHDSFVEPDETFEVFPIASYRTTNYRYNGIDILTGADYSYNQNTAAVFTIKDGSDAELPTVKAAQRSVSASNGDIAEITFEFSKPLPEAASFLVQASGTGDGGLVWDGVMAGYRRGSFKTITADAGSESVTLSFTVNTDTRHSFNLRLFDSHCLTAPSLRPIPTFADPDNPRNGLVGTTINVNPR